MGDVNTGQSDAETGMLQRADRDKGLWAGFCMCEESMAERDSARACACVCPCACMGAFFCCNTAV